MTDVLGFRAKIGFVVPSTNTSAQPEIDSLRPHGVTNHISRMQIQNSTMVEQPGFDQVLESIRGSATPAIESVCTADPDLLAIGVSPEAFWSGPSNQARVVQEFEKTAGGRPVITSADAITAALTALGELTQIAVITPYLPLGDDTVQKYFIDSGLTVVAIEGLGAHTPAAIAHIGSDRLRTALRAVDSADVQAIVQVGTNVPMARFAAAAEQILGKPVLSNNAVLYWHALRRMSILDQLSGHGMLFEHH